MASIPVPILKDETYTFKGFVSQADKQESDYLLLPFDVPDGIVRLDVRYEYSDETGAELWAPSGNVIDLGVFDSRVTTQNPGIVELHFRYRFRFTLGHLHHYPIVTSSWDDAIQP